MIIVGAGGHAAEVFEELSISQVDNQMVGFFDEINQSLNVLFELRVFHRMQDLTPMPFVLGVGSPFLRRRFYGMFLAAGFEPMSVISHSAQVSRLDTNLGNGLNIMSGVYIGPRTHIGKGCLINAKSLIHHDSTIGDFCELCPGVHVSGNCIIENDVFIGTGAVLLPGITVKKGAIVGAGAVVTKDVAAGVTVKGVPAK
jgi:sugar O-acyltransferase (sialic acid O-acetyltransferase NeuD family)